MRFNADVTAPELAAVARSMGLTGGSEIDLAEQAVQAVYELIAHIDLPQHLREVGVKEADLPQLAQLALKSQAVQNNPKAITSAAQTEAVLRAAW
jgi:alcohol dehydrogenase class IV